jgi:Ser/Thr protein kinase RdoA (MazF antagonist)
MREFYAEKGLESSPSIPEATWELFDEVRTLVEPRMNSLGEDVSVFGLIHNDIYQKNMLFHENSLRVIDFDNCGWGHYSLDIAVTLAQVRKHADFAQKKASFLAGYHPHRSLSVLEESLLDDFIAARILLLALYMASQVENEKMNAGAPAYVATVANDLRRWLTNGQIYG